MKKIGTIFLFSALSFAVPRVQAQDVTTTTTTTTTVTVTTAPPDLPVYEQPECPVDGYLWVPGYWAYDPANSYYWVPGVWVAPPDTGLLWTPAYWGFGDGVYGFHPGYWSTEIGYYGGINYGYGYGGTGFVGGSWSGGNFRYNTAVVNVNSAVVHNTYVDKTVIVEGNSRSSFNGPGGTLARPNKDELRVMNEKHIAPTGEQTAHQRAASEDRNQYASINRGHPAAVAMNKIGGRSVKESPRGAVNAGHVDNRPTNGLPHIRTTPVATPTEGQDFFS